jgi:hypothetical protein
MKAVVVFESHWGNTAAVARAVAEGIGPEVPALSTAEAVGAAMANAELIVAGAPLLGFRLPNEKMLDGVRSAGRKGPAPPDLSHPLLGTWLSALPAGNGRSAAFETRVRATLGGATETILSELERSGYRRLAKGERFVVKGKYGPLCDGELERARQWGAELAEAMK